MVRDRAKTVYVCENCGYESPRWLGRCPVCGAWNSFREVAGDRKKGEGRSWLSGSGERSTRVKLSQVKGEERGRAATGIKEFDRVMGGGVPEGALILIGGDPGIGKSTLLLQVASRLAGPGRKVLYVTGEESLSQLRERGERLGVDLEGIEALAEADLGRILEVASEFSPDFLFVDSIQTVYHPSLPSIPGTVSQVRECGAELLRFAKKTGCTVIIVGHVTKDGTLAGPRTLEHMVDAVLFFEGERTSGLRILRSIKNRFGSVDEIGVFEMGDRGLVEVENPSFLFISEERRERTGVALTALLEGVRPLLVEVQALVLSSPFAVPQRTATGYDVKRLSMLLAVLEKRTGMLLRKSDVFINVTGGIRINESAADLGVAVAIVSSRKKRPLSGTDLFVGEVGLGGEIRPVRGLTQRLREARRMGMKRAFVPAGSKIEGDPGIEIVGINDINEVIEICVG